MGILSLPQDRAEVSLPALPGCPAHGSQAGRAWTPWLFSLWVGGATVTFLLAPTHPASLLHCSSAPGEPALRCGLTAGTHASWRHPEGQRPGPPWPAGPRMCPFSSSGSFCLPVPLPWPPSSGGPHLGWFVSWAASPRPILVPPTEHNAGHT